jgi:plastocyanin
MKTKLYKIGLSMLIAIAFMLPSSAILADESKEAGEILITGDRPIAQDFPDDCFVQVMGLEGLEPGLHAPGCYDLIINLLADELCQYDLPDIKAFAEIYHIGCGEDVIMYETSFEDNFDIYNNWIQIDADCGIIGGQYDSWTWSDARASDGDHSFKSTMYDVYKGNQEDYLQCLKSFDISDQWGVNVSFDIYVDGDGGDQIFGWANAYTPIDYLDFEVSDDIYSAFDIWFNPSVYGTVPANWNTETEYGIDWMYFFDSYGNWWGPEAYCFWSTFMDPYDPLDERNFLPKVRDLGGGWWHVWWEVPTLWLEGYWDPYNPLNTEDIMFRFSWHTDPQFQFEGAYVDNFKVVSIEGVETKIFQTHSQGPFNLGDTDEVYYDEETHQYSWQFPLEWCAEFIEECGRKETEYEIQLWIEVLSDGWGTYDTFDPPFGMGPIIIPISIAEWFDVEVYDITVETSFDEDPIIIPPDDHGYMTAGDDAHIFADVHIAGSIPATDIPVHAYAQKKEWVTIMESDCESSSGLALEGLWHITDTDSWTGSSSLAYFDPDTNHYINNDDYQCAFFNQHIDMSEYEEVQLDFYFKYITEPNLFIHPDRDFYYLDEGDCWGIVFGDDSTNFRLSMRPILLEAGDEWRTPPWDTNGFHPEWIGPMQPMGEYVSFDVDQYYENWRDLKGQYHYGDGSKSYDLEIGFLWYHTDETGYTHPEADFHEMYWSGLYIDDITVKGLMVHDEKVWEDVKIIPGPVEACDIIEEVQFEWEDVPYSDYKITIESTAGCGNMENTNSSVQITVVSDKERADEKEVESIDLTGLSEGEWGICGSDTDNYLSTNPRTLLYDTEMFTAANLCLEGDSCLNISHLDLVDQDLNILAEDFATDIGGFTSINAGEFFWHPGQEAGGADPGQLDVNSGSIVPNGAQARSPVFDLSALDVAELTFVHAVNHGSGSFNIYVDTYDGSWTNGVWSATIISDVASTTVTVPLQPTDTQFRFRIAGVNPNTELGYWVIDDVSIDGIIFSPDTMELEFDAWFDCGWSDHAFAYIEISDVCPPDDLITDWETVGLNGFVDYMGMYVPSHYYDYYALTPSEIGDGWVHFGPIDLRPYVAGLDEFALRIVFFSDDYGFTFRGVLIDSFSITNLLYDDDVFPPEIEDFEDEFDDLDNWCIEPMHTGQFWEYMGDDTWCTDFPLVTFPKIMPVMDALVWTTEIMDCYAAWFDLEVQYTFAGKPGSHGEIQLSDDGGSTWYILDRFEGDSGGWVQPDNAPYDLTYWAGKSVLIRFLAKNGHGEHQTAGEWCVRDLMITGKQDHEGPVSSITMTGTMTDAGWYSSSVQATITAYDLGGSGIKEIHYILDGQETVVAGDSITFTISGNGPHNIEFWAVDNVGNVEPHNTVPTFRIDMGSPPSVAITAPEPGLYLFGNKILSLSKVFIIGAFTIEATASDAESGVYKVTFYLDDDVIADDTTIPYSAYCAQKHMGDGTIKVVAEDFAGNTAEDTLDITYYKFL